MPFKVVQTVENGELCLCAVPSRWENKGILHWPKKSAVARLCQDENSDPSPSWEKLNCVLKREFSTYSEAEHELDRMESIPDTEADEHEVVQPKAKKARRLNASNKTNNVPPSVPQQVFKDFNAFLTSPQTDQNQYSVEDVPMGNGDMVIEVEQPANVILYEQNWEQQGIPTNMITGSIPSTVTELNLPAATVDNLPVSDINEIVPEASLTAIVTNQLVIHNTLMKMMTCLAQLVTSVDILTEKVISVEKNVQSEPRATDTNVTFKPVGSLEEMDCLEAELKNESNMLRYIEKLSTVCGTSGKADGVDSAYRLIDRVATREIINMCSWTGQARENGELTGNAPKGTNDPDAGTSKIPLKFYKKFRVLFFRVIKLADQDFSEASSEKFLKGIMKNSKQRLTSKVMSTHKNRPKNY